MTPPAISEATFGPLIRDHFPPPWRWITVVSLWPSQQIVAHRDPPLPPGIRRYHIPLAVNEGCWALSGRDWQHLLEGRVYQMDPTEWHGAVNWGATIRHHLLIDCAEWKETQ